MESGLVVKQRVALANCDDGFTALVILCNNICMTNNILEL